MLELLLPVPPSLNGLYPGKTRRYKSRAYKNWLAEADIAFKQQESRHIPGRVHVYYRLHFPDNRRRDVANYEKAVSDFLVDKGLIEDDERIDSLFIERGEQGNGVYIQVEAL